MKKHFFTCAIFSFAFLIFSCANGMNSSENNSSSTPAQPTGINARMSFVNGYLSAWIEDNGKIISGEQYEDEDETKPLLKYQWYRLSEDEDEIDQLFSEDSYYEYDDLDDENHIIMAKITYKGNQYEVKSEKLLGCLDLDNSDINVIDLICEEGDYLESDDLKLLHAWKADDEDEEELDISDMSISFARVFRVSSENENVYTVSPIDDFYSPYSAECPVMITKPGYSTYILNVYVLVIKSFDDNEVPKLSKSIQNITRGCIRLEDTELDLEYKFGNEWLRYSSGKEIPVTSSVKEILVRKAAVGKEDDAVYIGYSDEQTIPVTNENIGVDVSKIPPVTMSNFESFSIDNSDIKILNMGNGAFYAALSNPNFTEENTTFEWYINDSSPEGFKGVTVSGATLQISPDSDIPKGTVYIRVKASSKDTEGLFYYSQYNYSF